MYVEPAPYLTSRIALFLSSSSLSLPLSPASLPSSPSPPSPRAVSSLSPPSLTSCIFITHASRKLARAAWGSKEKKNEQEKERNVCTRKGRVSRARYVLWSRNADSTWGSYFRLVFVIKNASLECRERKGRMLFLFDDVAIANQDYVERAFTHISSRSLEQLFHHARSNNCYSSHYTQHSTNN